VNLLPSNPNHILKTTKNKLINTNLSQECEIFHCFKIGKREAKKKKKNTHTKSTIQTTIRLFYSRFHFILSPSFLPTNQPTIEPHELLFCITGTTEKQKPLANFTNKFGVNIQYFSFITPGIFSLSKKPNKKTINLLYFPQIS
jgi:hypothetical protein